MLNLIERTITYSHRQWTDFTQDIYVDGMWIASAKNWSQADTVELVGAEQMPDPPPPPPPTSNPDIDNTPIVEGPSPMRAVSAQSIAIEARLTTCGYCAGIHHLQRCPEVRGLVMSDVLTCDECEHVLPRASFSFERTVDLCICDTCYADIMETAPIHQDIAPAPWSDPALGRELCRMKWRDFRGFVALLREVRDHGHLVTYAASYQAFIRSHRPDSDLTITQVLTAWAREMSGEPMPRIKVAA